MLLETACSYHGLTAGLGNHDITLDEPFYRQHNTSWRWPEPQDPEACARLLRESESITYLENETASVRLTSPNGPRTSFTVFGSPCTPKHCTWAFQYEAQDAGAVWSQVPTGVDVVVTHTPPYGLCDKADQDERTGCPALLQRLAEVKPLLSVCGHIHGGRGAERVTWRATGAENGSLVQDVERWTDAGNGTKKMAIVKWTSKLACGVDRTRQSRSSDSLEGRRGNEPRSGHGKAASTASLTHVALDESEARGNARAEAVPEGQPGTTHDAAEQWRETVVINAAHLGPRVKGKAVGVNKPIVVDVELPVWHGVNEDVR